MSALLATGVPKQNHHRQSPKWVHSRWNSTAYDMLTVASSLESDYPCIDPVKPHENNVLTTYRTEQRPICLHTSRTDASIAPVLLVFVLKLRSLTWRDPPQYGPEMAGSRAALNHGHLSRGRGSRGTNDCREDVGVTVYNDLSHLLFRSMRLPTFSRKACPS